MILTAENATLSAGQMLNPPRYRISSAQTLTVDHTGYDNVGAYFLTNIGPGEYINPAYSILPMVGRNTSQITDNMLIRMQWAINTSGTRYAGITSSLDPITGDEIINIEYAPAEYWVIEWRELYGHIVTPNSVVTDIYQDAQGRIHVIYEPFQILTQ